VGQIACIRHNVINNNLKPLKYSMKNKISFIAMALMMLFDAKSQTLNLSDVSKISNMDYKSIDSFLKQNNYSILRELRNENKREIISYSLYNKESFLDNFKVIVQKSQTKSNTKCIIVSSDIIDTTSFCNIITEANKNGFKIISWDIYDNTAGASLDIFIVSSRRTVFVYKKGNEELKLFLTMKIFLIPRISLPDNCRFNELKIEYKYSMWYEKNCLE
jgi:hypothetical protein